MLDLGYDFELCKESLLKAHNNIEKAIDIADNLMIENKVDAIKKIEIPKTKNKLIKMMLFICNYLEESTNNCILCHSKLESESIKLRTCTSEHCEFT